MISKAGRSRLIYFVMALGIMILGLMSRKFSHVFPWWVEDYLGDVLWGSMIFLGFSFAMPRVSTLKTAVLALGFCYAIEFSQLYQRDWIIQIRNTTLGALVLGRGFLVSDLISYALGIIVFGFLDKLCLKTK